MKRNLIIAAALLGFLLAVSACGAGGPSTDMNVSMTDFQFSPNTFTVPAGRVITVHAFNNGAVVHDFVLMKLGTTVGENYDEDDAPNVFWKIELQPGESTTTTFTAPDEPGEYQVVCGTRGHFEAGMIAKLTVLAQ